MDINKIYNMDCLIGMQEIPDKSVDCIICDLPYGKLKGWGDHTDWDVQIPLDELWQQYNRIAKENAAILLFGVEPFTSYLVMSNLKNYRQKITWIKNCPTNFFNAKKQLLNYTEDIILFYTKLPTFNPQMTNPERVHTYKRTPQQKGIFKDTCNGRKTYINTNIGYYPRNYIEFKNTSGFMGSKESRTYYHPTQKPVDLIRYLIRTYTNPGDLVLDNCMGSGTTAIAAMRENRNFIGFEMDEHFWQVCQQRLEDEKSYVEPDKPKPKPLNTLF